MINFYYAWLIKNDKTFCYSIDLLHIYIIYSSSTQY